MGEGAKKEQLSMGWRRRPLPLCSKVCGVQGQGRSDGGCPDVVPPTPSGPWQKLHLHLQNTASALCAPLLTPQTCFPPCMQREGPTLIRELLSRPPPEWQKGTIKKAAASTKALPE